MKKELMLENQICFPLYACSKEVVRIYKPYLDPLDLTYTQYIIMMVLWEHKRMTVKELGKRLYLDSGTLTPVLKKMESKGLLERNRSKTDERNLDVSITEKGEALQKEAVTIPVKVGKHINLDANELKQLYKTLYKILGSITVE